MMMEQSSCTEDRIQHVLERCLSQLGLDTPDKQLWNAGLCISRWCLEELVQRDPHNFLILLQTILMKTKEVLEQSRCELVVPLTLLFSSALLRTPFIEADSSILQEAYLLFHEFLAWPEPCGSACKRLLNTIQQELRTPGVSFQQLVKAEQGLYCDANCSKTIMVLLVSPDDEVPPEVQLASEQLSTVRNSTRDILTTLILHTFQAAFGTSHDLHALHTSLQEKQLEELEQLVEAITVYTAKAASVSDPRTAREELLHSLERLREGFAAPAPNTGSAEIFKLPIPKCHTCSWDEDNFDVLKEILTVDSDLDFSPECFLHGGIDDDCSNETSVDDEEEYDFNKVDHEFDNHRISVASSSSRDSTVSSYSLSSSLSLPSTSSGVESDLGEDMAHEDAEEGRDSQSRPRKKPKKKSKSLLGLERFSMLFKTPRGPGTCRRAQSIAYTGDPHKDFIRSGGKLKHSRSFMKQVCPLDPLSYQRQVCVRRRPILSIHEGDVAEVPTVVKVVVFGGDREAGRLARAYSDLQQRESKCPLLTRMCKIQFYLVPTKRHNATEVTGGLTPTEGQGPNGLELEGSTTDISHMLGLMDPWYERNVLSLLSLSSHVLCETASKDEDVSVSGGSEERLPLLADLVLYYCRYADQPVLVQLYQAELTLAGGEKRREVFIHTLELGHTAGTRAVKAMGAASKRFGIDEEREAVPLPLSIAYNKVVFSGRSQWIQTETVCTSINIKKTCRRPGQLESLQLTLTEVLKRQCPKSKKGYNQQILISEVKVDNVHVQSQGEGVTFAVCLDQDKKMFIQSVTRCEVSLCSKPGSGSDWKSYKPLPGQVQPLHPTYRSLLCLPITSFFAPHPLDSALTEHSS
nr:phosphoinositide 3-kinase regulatory subunit 5 [Nothobranchius furzeri]